MIGIVRNAGTRRLTALGATAGAASKARRLRSSRRTSPRLIGGRPDLRTATTHQLSSATLELGEFTVRRRPPGAGGDHPSFTLPTAGVAGIHEPDGLGLRRHVS